MKILFISMNYCYGDYITDALFYGLALNGHEIIDVPKRMQVYKGCPSNYCSQRKLWHYGWLDDVPKDRNKQPYENFDLIIFDSPQIYNDNPVFYKYKDKVVCLLTNSPLEHAPMPNVRAPAGIRMAIKEKCLQTPEINITANDFALNHTVAWQDCTPPEDCIKLKTKDVLLSMSIYGDLRKELANTYPNQLFDNKEDYFRAVRTHKYGISVLGDGYNCQRDAEIAGNAVLCKQRYKDWVYDETSFRDGINCIEFTTIQELKEKIEYYNNNPDKYYELLSNSFKHVIKYWTHTAQAKRFIDWVVHA